MNSTKRNNKKILFLSPQPFFQWRGTPIRVKANMLALSQEGYEVDLLTLPMGEDQRIEGVRILRVANPFGVRQVPIGPSAWKLFFDLLLFLKALRLCFKQRYAVIHGVEDAGFLAVLLARMFRARAIFEKHSDPFSYRGGTLKNLLMAMYARGERLTVRLSDAVIGTGPGLADQARSIGSRTPVFLIPDIASSDLEPTPEAVAAARAEWAVDPGDVLATYVGSFSKYQGLDLLFAAIPEALQLAPALRFVIVGGTPAEITSIRAVLVRKGVANRVVFAGHIHPDRLPAYLRASDLLLSPRISGVNTPLKVLDYFRAGRAIVATDVPANRHLLDEETAALSVPEPSALARVIAGMANQAERREALGLAGRRKYESTYTFALHRKRLAACYEQVLRPNANPSAQESRP